MRFETRAEFHAWLEQQGLAHVARLNLEAAAPWLDPSLWGPLRTVGAKRRLSDLASKEGLARARDWLAEGPLRDALPAAVEKLLEVELQSTAKAREQVPERVKPPPDAKAHAVHARLLALRRRIPSAVAPRVTEALDRDALEFDRALPGFTFKDLVPSELPLRAGGSFGRAQVKLALPEAGARFDCTCGATDGCVHVLAAIDTALLVLADGLDDARLAELNRPAWQRALALLDTALAQSVPTPAQDELSFRIRVHDDEGVEVTAWLEGTQRTRAALLALALPPAESPLVALLPDEGAFASRALLEGLLDHPRVFLWRAPESAVQIERAQVGIVAEERLGTVRLSAGIEGAAFPPFLLERVRKAMPDELLYLWDEGPRRLTLLEVKPEVRAMLNVLRRENTAFPPEAHGALLQTLSKWAQQVPVAMPRSVMGESVASQLLPVLRLEVRPNGDVEVEFRMKALPDAPSLRPGAGPRDVHLRRGEKAVHAVRELRHETAFIDAMLAELPLSRAEVDPNNPYLFTFQRVDEVFELLELCSRRAVAPELEWVGKPLRNLGSTGVRALKVKVEQRTEWFGVLGELNVLGERVELARLMDAARRQARFVEVASHTYVELNEALRRHLERVADHATVTRAGLQLGPAAVESLRALQTAGARVEVDGAWAKLAERIEAARALVPNQPKGLTATLRPYQLDGFRWLTRLAAWGAGGVLADDMGLGKTVQALAVLVDRASQGPALVVAPTSVAFNWRDEAARFAPGLRLLDYSESKNRAHSLVQLKAGDVVVISYGLLVRDAKELAKIDFATVVFDEAQHLKNAHTQRFHAAKALRAGFRVALSGTPVENHLGELWSLFALVFPPLLGSWDTFRTRFALPIEKQLDPAAAPALARVIEPFLLRRTKSEVEAELPSRTEVKVPVVLSGPEWQLYEDTRLAALSDLESPRRVLKAQERKVQVLALLTRLRLVACHPRLHDASSQVVSAKLTRLLELVDELLAEGQRMLIFSQFTSHLELVKEALTARGLTFVSLDGSTSAPARRARVQEFQEGDAPIFLLSLKAGGVGLNLTAATNVIHLDPWWNPAVEDQASDRAHRLGQKRPVTIYRLVAVNTVEELMLSLHERKRALIAKVLSGSGKGAGSLSTDELLALFATPAS